MLFCVENFSIFWVCYSTRDWVNNWLRYHSWPISIQVNIWKFIYLDCGEWYENMIDHHSYVHNLSSCEIIILRGSNIWTFVYSLLLYRHECFTGKYATHKIHMQPHPGLEWRIFHILTSQDIDAYADIKYVSLIVLKFVGVWSKYLRVFLESLRQSSVIFGNFRKMFGNVPATFGQILENLRNSSESGRKSSENRQLRRH